MDKQSFSQFIEKEGRAIYSFCLYLTRKRDLADEIFQEACLAAWERHEEIDQQLNPKSFILSIASSKWKNHWRKTLRRKKILPLGSLDEALEHSNQGARVLGHAEKLNAEELYFQNEAHESLHNALASLNDCYRIPILMHYTGGLSYLEIAEAMNLPLGTVKRRIFEGKQRLRRILQEMEGKADYAQEQK